MNGYKMLADSYRKLAEQEQDENTKAELLKKASGLDFLASCDKSAIYSLFDSSAFNDITKAYCNKAMLNCGISDEQRQSVLDELHRLFSEVNAKEIMG